MSTTMTQGANSILPNSQATIEVTWSPVQIANCDIDMSAFLLSANNKVRGDCDMVFYNQPSSENGAIRMSQITPGRQIFNLLLANISQVVEKIAFVLTIHEADKAKAHLGHCQSIQVCISSGSVNCVYQANDPRRTEAALILVECYRYRGTWKVRAVGQGFAGGLGPLATTFGVNIGPVQPFSPILPLVDTLPTVIAPLPSTAARSGPEVPQLVSPTKMAIILVKGQKISLKKEAGTSLTKVIMGLGWDVFKPIGIAKIFNQTYTIDLDASCIMFDVQGNNVDAISFRQLRSKDGSIVHTGDNRTGAGDGDDEQIIVNLPMIPVNIKTLMFTVNSFTGQSFDKIENAFCRIVDSNNDREIARFNLSCQGKHTGQIMAKLYRDNGEWKMQAIGENVSGRTFVDMLPHMRAYL